MQQRRIDETKGDTGEEGKTSALFVNETERGITDHAKEPIKLTKPSKLDAPAHEMREHPRTVMARNVFFCHLTCGETM
jgi:hypothetical protein